MLVPPTKTQAPGNSPNHVPPLKNPSYATAVKTMIFTELLSDLPQIEPESLTYTKASFWFGIFRFYDFHIRSLTPLRVSCFYCIIKYLNKRNLPSKDQYQVVSTYNWLIQSVIGRKDLILIEFTSWYHKKLCISIITPLVYSFELSAKFLIMLHFSAKKETLWQDEEHFVAQSTVIMLTTWLVIIQYFFAVFTSSIHATWQN